MTLEPVGWETSRRAVAEEVGQKQPQPGSEGVSPSKGRLDDGPAKNARIQGVFAILTQARAGPNLGPWVSNCLHGY